MIAIVVAALLAADDLQTLEAEGQAALSLGHTQAVQQAKDQALRNLVLSACKRAMTVDPKIEQCAIADDRVFAGFQGVVQKLEVLSTDAAGELIKVKIRAQVSLKNLSNEEVEAQRLYRRIGGLKVSVGIDEKAVEADGSGGKRAVQGISLLASPLCAIVRADGWRVFTLPAFSGLDTGPVVEAAKPDATDYALVGEVSVETVGGRAHLTGTLRLISVSTALLVATVPVDETAGSNRGSAAVTVVGRQAAAVLAPKLRLALIKALRETEMHGAELTISITGVTSTAQADALVAAIKAMPQVADAQAAALDGGMLVTVRSSNTANELAKALAKATKATLSITAVKGTAVEAVAK